LGQTRAKNEKTQKGQAQAKKAIETKKQVEKMKKIDLIRAKRPIGSIKQHEMLAGGLQSLADLIIMLAKGQRTVWILTIVNFLLFILHFYHFH